MKKIIKLLNNIKNKLTDYDKYLLYKKPIKNKLIKDNYYDDKILKFLMILNTIQFSFICVKYLS